MHLENNRVFFKKKKEKEKEKREVVLVRLYVGHWWQCAKGCGCSC
jgi:hypothetical protein